jgi:hypothetical protein
MQTTDASLVRHLEAKHIPFVTFDGAEAYQRWHWRTLDTGRSQGCLERLFGLLSANY